MQTEQYLPNSDTKLCQNHTAVNIIILNVFNRFMKTNESTEIFNKQKKRKTMRAGKNPDGRMSPF